MALFCPIITFVILLPTLAGGTHSRQTSVMIRVLPETPAKAFIEVSSAPSRTWSFRNEYAGVSELGKRIEAFKAFDSSGVEVSTHQLAPGQFTTMSDAVKFRYEVNLTPPQRAGDAARVSWVSGSRGLLMLADLLPTPETPQKGNNGDRPGQVHLNLPNGWIGYSNEMEGAPATFVFEDAETTILVIGDRLRASQISIAGLKLKLLTDSVWPFTDGEVTKEAADVLQAHYDLFGAMPTTRATLTLLPFPTSPATEKWSAETRGTCVTILFAGQPAKRAALSQLSVPLTHELFHLWIPNGLTLTGNYDWFYEGFTLYQSARVEVRLGFLTFQEFLNAIARAYDSYLATADRDRWSLIEASQRRWTSGQSTVYNEGMVVAFLYDLKLREQSRNKRSLENVYAELFHRHRGSSSGDHAALQPQDDANNVVMEALSRELDMKEFVADFVGRPARINLSEAFKNSGLVADSFGVRSRISVGETLTRQQRDLLRDLGYNDSGRLRPRK